MTNNINKLSPKLWLEKDIRHKVMTSQLISCNFKHFDHSLILSTDLQSLSHTDKAHGLLNSFLHSFLGLLLLGVRLTIFLRLSCYLK